VALVLLFLGLTAGRSWADSEAEGSANFAGRSITWKLTGEESANVSSSANNKECVIKIDLDGKKQELRVTKTELVYQGMKIPLTAFKKMEVTGDADKVRIVVDGNQVFPRTK
jgi:hypothetical protein